MSEPLDSIETKSKETPTEQVDQAFQCRFRIVYPRELTTNIELGTETVVLGRRPEQDDMPRLVHETVSRSHVRVGWDGQSSSRTIEELGSRNGSRLNGQPLSAVQQPLSDGDVLQLGDVLLIYEANRGVIEKDCAEVSRVNVPGEAATMYPLRSSLAHAAPDRSPVLIVGDTGVGKQWIAKEIHRLSERQGSFIELNCSTLNLSNAEDRFCTEALEAFRAAAGGTLLFDEITALPINLQPKLFQMLQDGQSPATEGGRPRAVDVRIIATTNERPDEAVTTGQLRRDLYGRLALWQISVPNLRQRRADILMWIDQVYQGWLREHEGDADNQLSLSADAAEKLVRCDWPENLRGVSRLVNELVARKAARVGSITAQELPSWLETSSRSQTGLATSEADQALKPENSPNKKRRARVPAPSRQQFVAAYETLDGSVHALARHFDRDRRQIYRWLDAYGLRQKRLKSNS